MGKKGICSSRKKKGYPKENRLGVDVPFYESTWEELRKLALSSQMDMRRLKVEPSILIMFVVDNSPFFEIEQHMAVYRRFMVVTFTNEVRLAKLASTMTKIDQREEVEVLEEEVAAPKVVYNSSPWEMDQYTNKFQKYGNLWKYETKCGFQSVLGLFWIRLSVLGESPCNCIDDFNVWSWAHINMGAHLPLRRYFANFCAIVGIAPCGLVRFVQRQEDGDKITHPVTTPFLEARQALYQGFPPKDLQVEKLVTTANLRQVGLLAPHQSIYVFHVKDFIHGDSLDFKEVITEIVVDAV
uniref:Uncharacterized protein n=1 Tax=Cannabis sativa TaxID=3483 RepID=A0A803NR16_CANSA